MVWLDGGLLQYVLEAIFTNNRGEAGRRNTIVVELIVDPFSAVTSQHLRYSDTASQDGNATYESRFLASSR